MISRDRVTYARRCVDALWAAGLDVIVVDHGSNWPPMVDWLCEMDAQYVGEHPFEVAWWPNRHPRDLWAPGGAIERRVKPGERFIVTDCDVVPDDDCPADWVRTMGIYLDHLPAVRKVGLGLRTDDLPPCYARRDEVQAWEARYQAPTATPVGDGGVLADIDTTLAMYRGFEPFALGPAVRLQPPYVARHLPWYEDTANPTREQVHYQRRAQHGHWRDPDNYNDDHALGGST